MKLRFRPFAALVALVALTVYFAEGVWASMCLPDMVLSGVELMVGQDAEEDPCPMASAHAGSADPESEEPAEPTVPSCPLGPPGATGSCVAVSIPAPTVQLVSFNPEEAVLSTTPDAAHDLLLAAALFHPPRA